jgi:NDP-sugar pyrophosphorylase family protein
LAFIGGHRVTGRPADGMIFAAGLGTRLLPLTRDTPKALLEVGGATLLERTVERLAEAGCDRIVVNVHHHAERIAEALASMKCVAEIVLSWEREAPLETGGGLKHAAPHFRGDRPILIHNVDVISDLDLAALLQDHDASGALATLAVNQRPASRLLLFDDRGLCSRLDRRSGVSEWSRSPSAGQRWRAFTGVQAVAAELPRLLSEGGAFSIVRSYLRLSAAGGWVRDRDVTGATWLDVGTPERLESARER